MILSSVVLSKPVFTGKPKRPACQDEVPLEIDPKYRTPESRARTVTVLGSSRNSEDDSDGKELGYTLVSRGYNTVTGAGNKGKMGATNIGAHQAEEETGGNRGRALGIMTRQSWGDEDFKNCDIIGQSSDDFSRVSDFTDVSDHTVVLDGGATTVAEAAMMISKAKYPEKGRQKPDISLVGDTYEPLNDQYGNLERKGTLGAKRSDLYSRYKDVKDLLEKKFPSII